MRNGNYDRNATCPYYKGVTVTKGGQVVAIGCECIAGNIGFNCNTMLRFKTKAELDDYFELFCADINSGCPYYQAIENGHK